MPDGSIDVGSLEGDELTRWYLRSPADIEQERQAAAAKRYQDFYGASGTDPDPGFAREVPRMDHDVDPGFAVALPPASHDIDPGFTWVPVGPNRLRSVRLTSNDQSSGPLSPGSVSYGGAASAGDANATAKYQKISPLEGWGSKPDLTPQPVPQLDGQLIGPPIARFGPLQPAASQGRPQASAYGRGGRASAPGHTPAMQPGRQPIPASRPGADQAIAYGALRAPAPSDQDLAELRRQQAAFANTTRQIDIQNSWFAVPALAPAVVALGLGAAGEWAAGEFAPAAGRAVANFVDREAWQRGAQKAAQALSDAEKNALRAAGRAKFARANGISASEMQAEVHHSDPLEWAHLKPNADPNRLANLWGLRGEAHDIATRAWADFTRGLKGRIPTQAELMEAKLRIDRMVEPYVRRAGVPRSNTPPREGGPI
jgi:hypothetical protein